jgi:hypothetical protein
MLKTRILWIVSPIFIILLIIFGIYLSLEYSLALGLFLMFIAICTVLMLVLINKSNIENSYTDKDLYKEYKEDYKEEYPNLEEAAPKKKETKFGKFIRKRPF